MQLDSKIIELASEDYEAEISWTRLIQEFDQTWLPGSKFTEQFGEAGGPLELGELNALTDRYINEKGVYRLEATGTLAIAYLNKYLKQLEVNVRLLNSGSIDALQFPRLRFLYRVVKWCFAPIVLLLLNQSVLALVFATLLVLIFIASKFSNASDTIRFNRQIRVLKLARQEIRDGSIDVQSTISHLLALAPAFVANGRLFRLLRQLEHELQTQHISQYGDTDEH
jgi:hypothetical protein